MHYDLLDALLYMNRLNSLRVIVPLHRLWEHFFNRNSLHPHCTSASISQQFCHLRNAIRGGSCQALAVVIIPWNISLKGISWNDRKIKKYIEIHQQVCGLCLVTESCTSNPVEAKPSVQKESCWINAWGLLQRRRFSLVDKTLCIVERPDTCRVVASNRQGHCTIAC